MGFNDHIDLNPTLFREIDDKFVCVDCLYDEGLKLFALQRCPPSGHDCSYCGGASKSIPVSKVQSHVLAYFSCVFIEEVMPRNDGEWLLPGKSGKECLEEMLLHAVCDDLYTDLEENVVDALYCERDWQSLPISDQWKGQWKEFSTHVRYQDGRFGFDEGVINRERSHDERHPLDFFNAISVALLRTDGLSLLPVGTIIHRVREGHGFELTFDHLTCPPDRFAATNRFSPQGVSRFYGATSLATACLEIKVPSGTPVSAGEFKTRRPLALIDFTAVRFPKGKFDPSWIGNYHIAEFLNGFLVEIRKDAKGDMPDTTYLPTQALCDFFSKSGAAHLCDVNMWDPQPSPVIQQIDQTGKIDGIRFISAKVDSGSSDCFVLFCNQSESASMLELVNATRITVP